MNQTKALTLAFGAGLLYSILFLRFAGKSLGWRSEIRHKKLACCLAAAVMTGILSAARLYPVFTGISVAVGCGGLLLFSGTFLAGPWWKRGLVSLLLPVTAAACEGIGAALLGPVLGDRGEIWGTLLALCIFFGVCRGALRKPPLSQGVSRVFLVWQAVSAVLLLLLLFMEKGLLQAVVLAAVIGWGFGLYSLLDEADDAHRKERDRSLVTHEKNSQLRVEELQYQYAQLQKVRHDFNNTLSVIRSLNAERKADKIDAYIDAYLETAHVSATFIASDNAYANAIINAKAAQAREAGIEVKIVISTAIGGENPVDICNLLGNLFDNAIAACQKVENNPRISLHIYEDGEATVLSMKNSIRHSVLEFNPQLRTEKADARNHGYGTAIIRDIAAKYNGFADFYEESGEFCCNAVLYLS